MTATLEASLPAVLARMMSGAHVVLLGPAELQRCNGSPEQLVAEIRGAAQRCGVSLA